MKRLITGVLALVMACSLVGCTGTYYPSSEATKISNTSSVENGAATHEYGLEFAKQYLSNYKAGLKQTKKDSYFQSAEWHAFVDSYWASYNAAQSSDKNPQTMPKDQITY
jgi:hypothetical protein